MPITRLLLVLEVWDGKPSYRKSFAENLLVWSDFTLGFSFKVKRCLNGFGEFSLWWIQFASVLRCDRSSFSCNSVFLHHGIHFFYASMVLQLNSGVEL